MEADLLDLHDGDPVLCSLGLDAVDGKVIHRVDSRFAAARVAFEVEATA
jgi:DNA-binding GntR family transcriptional regulator